MQRCQVRSRTDLRPSPMRKQLSFSRLNDKEKVVVSVQ